MSDDWPSASDRRRILADFEKVGEKTVRGQLSRGIYLNTPVYQLALDWLAQKDALRAAQAQAEAAELSRRATVAAEAAVVAAREANEIALQANTLAERANNRSLEANRTAKFAMMASVASAIIAILAIVFGR